MGLVAGATAFLAAQPYPGATVDSGEYLAVAEGIVERGDLSMPYVGYDERFRVLEPGQRVTMTQFPPLYPVLLAGTRWLGLSTLDGARVLGALCFAVTGWTAAALVSRETGNARSVLLSGALLLSADLVIIHAMAWSETVMLSALIAALAFTVRYFRGGRFLDLAAAGAWVVVAGATRFVGLSAALAIVVGVVAVGNGGFFKRLERALVFLAACIIPTAAWFVRNDALLGSPSEKEVGWYLPGLTHVQQALSTIGGWVVPWKEAMPFVGAAVVVGGLVLGARRLLPAIGAGPSSLARACVWFGISYLLAVLLSRSLLDQNIAFDFRILSPLYVLLAVGLSVVVRDLRGTAGIALALVAVASLGRGVDAARNFSDLSVAGYTGNAWRASPTLRYAGATSPDAVLITNAPDPIWIWHRRTSIVIPPRSSLYSGEPNEAYSQDVADIHEATTCRRALVVFFDQPTRKPRRYIEPLLVRGLGLDKAERFSDGEIYEVTEPKCQAEP